MLLTVAEPRPHRSLPALPGRRAEDRRCGLAGTASARGPASRGAVLGVTAAGRNPVARAVS